MLPFTLWVAFLSLMGMTSLLPKPTMLKGLFYYFLYDDSLLESRDIPCYM